MKFYLFNMANNNFNLHMNKTTSSIPFIKILIIAFLIPYIAWLYSYTYDNYIFYSYDDVNTYIKIHKIAEYRKQSQFNEETFYIADFIELENYKHHGPLNYRLYNDPKSFLTFINIWYPKPIIILESIIIFITSLFHFGLTYFIISFLILNYPYVLISVIILMIFSIISFYKSINTTLSKIISFNKIKSQ